MQPLQCNFVCNCCSAMVVVQCAFVLELESLYLYILYFGPVKKLLLPIVGGNV